MSGKRKLKPHEQREQGKRDYLSRRVATKLQKKSFLIVCEGSKTEPEYFEALKAIWELPISINIVGGAGVPLSIVENAIELRDESKNVYDEIWVVFDRDSFPSAGIHTAFAKAKNEDIKIAFSNEAFEFWYILHYEPRVTGMNRTEYQRKLTKHMGIKYKKNDPKTFERLRQKMPVAVRNARRIAQAFEMYDHKLIDTNPYTGIYLLVKALMPENKETVEETLKDCAMQKNEYEQLNQAFTKQVSPNFRRDNPPG